MNARQILGEIKAAERTGNHAKAAVLRKAYRPILEAAARPKPVTKPITPFVIGELVNIPIKGV